MHDAFAIAGDEKGLQTWKTNEISWIANNWHPKTGGPPEWGLNNPHREESGIPQVISDMNEICDTALLA